MPKETLCAGGLACYSLRVAEVRHTGAIQATTWRGRDTFRTLIIGLHKPPAPHSLPTTLRTSQRLGPLHNQRTRHWFTQPAQRSIRTQHTLCTPPWFAIAQARSPGQFGPATQPTNDTPVARIGPLHNAYERGTLRSLIDLRMLPRAVRPLHSPRTRHSLHPE